MSPSNGNETCVRERAEAGPPLFQDGKIVFQAYHFGWIIAGFFALFASGVSIWLINKHLQWYHNKREQRYIVRILFMVPIYALVSFASFLFWNNSTILILIRDGYESTVLTSFFYLLLLYLSHNTEEQKTIFRGVGLSRQSDLEAMKRGEQPKKWVFPLGFLKWKPQDGLYFLQSMKWGVLQYCVIRPTTTLAAVILDYNGLYCEESWGLGWGHIYIVIIVSLSVTVAMYCLIQLYVPVSKNLAPQRPLLKLFAIKAVVFLTFWQATFLSVLSMFGVVKDTKYMTAADINIGIGAILETVEMTLFAFLHIRAFTYKTYQPTYSPDLAELELEHTPRLRSLGHAMDFRETFREIWVGCVYIWDKMRGREPTPDVSARRVAYYEEAFGRPRTSRLPGVGDKPKKEEADTLDATLPKLEVEVDEHVDIDIDGEKQWLGVGHIRRERSDSLTVQIERELEKRGYSNNVGGRNRVAPPSGGLPMQDARRQISWWRRMYNRFSEHVSEYEHEQGHALSIRRPRRRSRKRSKGGDDRELLSSPEDIDHLLPRDIAHRHIGHRDNLEPSMRGDILTPLPTFNDSRISRQWAPGRMSVSEHLVADVGCISAFMETNNAESPHADNLLGPIFPSTTTGEGSDVATQAGTQIVPRSSGTPNAARHPTGDGGSGVPSPHHRHRDALGLATVEGSRPAVRSPSQSHHSFHRRESAHDHGSSLLSPLRSNGSPSTEARGVDSNPQITRHATTSYPRTQFSEARHFSSRETISNNLTDAFSRNIHRSALGNIGESP